MSVSAHVQADCRPGENNHTASGRLWNPCTDDLCAQLFSWVQLCDPMNYSLPGSSVHGICQARIQEWVVISYSSVLPQHRDQACLLHFLHWKADSLPPSHLGSPASWWRCPNSARILEWTWEKNCLSIRNIVFLLYRVRETWAIISLRVSTL